MLNLKNKNLIFYFLVGLSVLFAAGSVSVLKNPVLDFSKFPSIAVSAVRREFMGIIFYHRNYVQNEHLRNEADFFRQKVNSLNEIDLENLRLRKLLSFKQELPFKVIAARVIARSPDNWYSVIIIDKGSSGGVQRGQAVINNFGLIGRVMDTTAFTSKVMLISDPNLSVSAIVERSREVGLITGTLGTQLLMKYLPQDADIKAQDKIITSGMNRNYPKGLPIGNVVEVGNEFSSLGRYAVIKPAVNLSFLEEVFVIVK
ncbi:MAG: rod shape-determining protein MreC [Candidatus Omnitrophota bacterium]